jgi:curved DNA-binding protein CbpA
MKDILECYKILGIEPGCPAERVRKAYLQLSHFYDPAKYVEADREHQAHAEEKKKEIEEAYSEIRHFLPELQGDQGRLEKAMEQNRDFKEMVRQAPAEVSKTLMAIIIGGALLLLFAWAYYIYRQTRILPAAPTPVSDVEKPTDVLVSTATVPAPAAAVE